MNTPLFSLIIVCYRKFEHLYAAVNSALSQNYPNIELIISDDGSPNFPREDIESYILKHKGKNITNVIIRQEETNCGTVRHLNHVIEKCHGKYIVALAGDDVFYNDNVLSAYVEGFSHAPDHCYIEMAQTAMYNTDLTDLECYYLRPIVQEAIEKTETDSSDLLQALIKYRACLPSPSTCFKREFFDKFGKFDENYTLIEDYPMHIRLAKENWIIHYENFVAIKHRNGGISHGGEGAVQKSVISYLSDTQRALRELVLPLVSTLEPKDQKETRCHVERQLLLTRLKLAKIDKRMWEIILLGLRHPLSGFSFVVGKIGFWAAMFRKRLFLPMIALLAFSPKIAQMTELVSSISLDVAMGLLAGIRLALCVLWLISLLLTWMDSIRQKVDWYAWYWLSIN